MYAVLIRRLRSAVFPLRLAVGDFGIAGNTWVAGNPNGPIREVSHGCYGESGRKHGTDDTACVPIFILKPEENQPGFHRVPRFVPTVPRQPVIGIPEFKLPYSGSGKIPNLH